MFVPYCEVVEFLNLVLSTNKKKTNEIQPCKNIYIYSHLSKHTLAVVISSSCFSSSDVFKIELVDT